MDPTESKDTSQLFPSVERVTNNLQNIRLDASPKTSVHYETDTAIKKNSSISTVNQTKDNSVRINLQFGSNDVTQSVQSSQLQNESVVNETKPVVRKEPVVCRIFAEAPPQPDISNDPTKNFFDIIGQSTVIVNSTPNIIADVGLNSNEHNSEDGLNSLIFSNTEIDRRRDAWIPSEKTRQALIACVTSPPGTYFPDRDSLTMPGVMAEDNITDALHDAVLQFLGPTEAAQRKTLGAADVTQDERGLRELIQAGCYRAAINLTGQLLTIYGQGLGRVGHPSKHSPHSLQLWFTRLALLIKIGAFIQAEQESLAFGNLDKPDLFYQFYPDMYGGRPGSMATFSFRLLLAELPMHCEKPQESMRRLCANLAIIRTMLRNLHNSLAEDGSSIELSELDRNDSIGLWSRRETRVLHSVVNCALVQKDYCVAIQVLKQLINNNDWSINHKRSLYSALGRVHLQLGDIIGAEGCFVKSRELNSSPQVDVRDLVDQSLIALSQNALEDARQLLETASELDPGNVMVLNNTGVCLLYSGRLKEAVAALETAVTANPSRGLHPQLLLNLCTLYELESSKAEEKKLVLLKQLAKYKADCGVNVVACLKLNA